MFKDPGSDLKILCMVESLRYLSTMGFFSVIVATVTSHKSLSVSCFVQFRVKESGGFEKIRENLSTSLKSLSLEGTGGFEEIYVCQFIRYV